MRREMVTGAASNNALPPARKSTSTLYVLLRELNRGLSVQCNVIGALLMRELHTRYGRENIGYLWMFGEPMSLAAAVSAMHATASAPGHAGTSMVTFALLGYSMFMMFRGMVTRAEGTLEANMPLLYHRNVTIFDMLFSRALLEGAATFATFLIILAFFNIWGIASPPARPLDLLLGVGLMFWFSFSMSLIVSAATHENRLAARLVHPIVYLLLPLSGAFFELSWIPEPYRSWMAWFPLTEINEQMRYGLFEDATNKYVAIPYIIGCCLVPTYVGMVSIKIVRRHIHLR